MAPPKGYYCLYEIQACFSSESNHYGIYVQTDEGGVGQFFHVRCAVGKTGMMFERQYFLGPGPEALATFKNKTYIGIVKGEDLDRMADICSTIDAPETQFIDSTCQCGTWVDKVHGVLKAQGILG
ncbi:hypothetical protein Trco_007250 [Trichoderma cornu-damae]|uniref:Uncharacterized protein n=1 Tax=Trichoderma cornu-damae TaxID=654480 RepID=A0A9P8TU69_9HYPO|nr:hypothetical protein Trco_007250 [Trichoderma cornu-damae]